jgi:hypothetical protein
MLRICYFSSATIALLIAVVIVSALTVHAITFSTSTPELAVRVSTLALPVKASTPALPVAAATPERTWTVHQFDIDPNMTFDLLPQNVSAAVGATFEITVAVENVTDMSGWQVYMCFDSAVLECTGVSLPSNCVFSGSVTVSGALADYDATEFPQGLLRRIRNDEGWVLAGDCLMGMSQPSFNGSGVLCRVEFKAISPGSTTLALLHDSAHTFQTYTITSGSALMTAPSASCSNIVVSD